MRSWSSAAWPRRGRGRRRWSWRARCGAATAGSTSRASLSPPTRRSNCAAAIIPGQPCGGVKLAHALDRPCHRSGGRGGARYRRLDRRLHRRVARARRGAGLCRRCRARAARLEAAPGPARHRARAGQCPLPDHGRGAGAARFRRVRCQLHRPRDGAARGTRAGGADGARLVALIKPQFEVGPARVGKGGVVRDPALHSEVCERIAAWLGSSAWLAGRWRRRKPAAWSRRAMSSSLSRRDERGMARGEIVLHVESVGVRGDGVAHLDGAPIFLPFTAPGDVVRARLGERRGEGSSGAVVGFVARGARAEPSCPYFGLCGGCALQHLAPESYAATGARLVRGGARPARTRRGRNSATLVSAGGNAPARTLRPSAPARRAGRDRLSRPREPSHCRYAAMRCAASRARRAGGQLRGVVPSLFAPGTKGAATATLAETGIDLLLDLAAPPALATLETMAAFAASQDLARLHWRVAGEAHRHRRRSAARCASPSPAWRSICRMTYSFKRAPRPMPRSLRRCSSGSARRIASPIPSPASALSALPSPRARAVHAVDGSGPAIDALRAAARRVPVWPSA